MYSAIYCTERERRYYSKSKYNRLGLNLISACQFPFLHWYPLHYLHILLFVIKKKKEKVVIVRKVKLGSLTFRAVGLNIQKFREYGKCRLAESHTRQHYTLWAVPFVRQCKLDLKVSNSFFRVKFLKFWLEHCIRLCMHMYTQRFMTNHICFLYELSNAFKC